MRERLRRIMKSHPGKVISISAFFGLLLVAFAFVETRLLPDGFPYQVRGVFGLVFIGLFGYSIVVGTVYIAKLELAKTAACFVTAAALWGLYTATHAAGYDIIGCKPRYKSASDIDWQYVRQEVARQLNKRGVRPFIVYKKVLTADDIQFVGRTAPFEGTFGETISFDFKIPDYPRNIPGAVDMCSNVEVW